MIDATALLQVINTTGVIGILVFFIIAFYRGDIMPKAVFEKILDRLLKDFAESWKNRQTESEEKILAAINKKRGW